MITRHTLIILPLQGKKNYQKKLFISFQLSDHIPTHNFYKRLNDTLDLDFVYRATAKYYGREGQKSIDPVVFMMLMLVGYLKNLSSDRKIISTSRVRMDIMFFLAYDLDEELPWHSTLSERRDSQCLPDLVKRTVANLKENGLKVEAILANTNYSSMDTLNFMRDNTIDAYTHRFSPCKLKNIRKQNAHQLIKIDGQLIYYSKK